MKPERALLFAAASISIIAAYVLFNPAEPAVVPLSSLAIALPKSAFHLNEPVAIEARAGIELDKRQGLYQPLLIAIKRPDGIADTLTIGPPHQLDCVSQKNYCFGIFTATYTRANAEGEYALASSFLGVGAEARMLVHSKEMLDNYLIQRTIGRHAFNSSAVTYLEGIPVALFVASYRAPEPAIVFVYSFASAEAAEKKLASVRSVATGNFTVPAGNATLLHPEPCCVWWLSGNFALMVSSAGGEMPLEVIAAYLEKYPSDAPS